MTAVALCPIWTASQFFDNNGNLLSGGKIFTYAAGSSSTLQTTYTDHTGATPNANPIVLDSSGRIDTAIWLTVNESYHLVLTLSDGTTVLQNVDYVEILSNTLETLTDVDITSPTNGQVLTYNSSTSQWNNENVPTPVGLVQAGTIIDFAGPSYAIPTGYLNCDGSAVSRTTYSVLFAAISTTWGSGDGSTTFNLPNLQGLVTVGAGYNFAGILGPNVGNTGGEGLHTLVISELPSHTHTPSDPGHHHTGGRSANGTGVGPGWGSTVTAVLSSPANTGTTTTGITIGNTGGGAGHNNIQPSGVCYKLIKT